MDRMKLLGVIGLLSVLVMILLTGLSLAGVGVESQLLGSDWQVAGIVTGAATVVALVVFAAVGGAKPREKTSYW